MFYPKSNLQQKHENLMKWQHFLDNLNLTDTEIINSFSNEDLLFILGERNSKVLSAREKKKTFKKIGEEFGVNPSRARQVYRNGVFKLKEKLFERTK